MQLLDIIVVDAVTFFLDPAAAAFVAILYIKKNLKYFQ